MRRVTAAEKINRALANYLALPLPSHQRDSPTLAADVLPARSTNCSAGFTEEHVLQPRVQSIRVLQKLPQGRGGLHFPESNSWQTDELIADWIGIISSWSEGRSSLTISACKAFWGSAFSDKWYSDRHSHLSVTKTWNFFKTSETLWNYLVHNIVLLCDYKGIRLPIWSEVKSGYFYMWYPSYVGFPTYFK